MQKASKTDDENRFWVKWHFRVIQGQAAQGHWKADKARHDIGFKSKGSEDMVTEITKNRQL